MQLIIDVAGSIACLYDEAIDLAALGSLAIRRASHVEPDEKGRWLADLGPVGGPVLGPFDRRSEALDAEREWLEFNRLAGAKSLSVSEQQERRQPTGMRAGLALVKA